MFHIRGAAAELCANIGGDYDWRGMLRATGVVRLGAGYVLQEQREMFGLLRGRCTLHWRRHESDGSLLGLSLLAAIQVQGRRVTVGSGSYH